jgi:DNA replication protein DnaC
MQHSKQLQPIGKVLEFPQRAAAPTPAFTSKEDYYSPTVCRTCKFELAIGTHGYLSGGYKDGKTVLINCPTCTVDAQRQATEIKQAEMIARLFNGAHLPFGTRHWRFDTYPQDADKEALSTVRHFLKRWRECDEDGKRGLFLGGETGRCKTSLAISALKEVMEAGYIGLFVSVPDLLKKIQATYNKQSEVTENELLEAVYTVPWLVLDDLGVEKPTEFAVKEFYLIIEKRRMNGLWTIITSNLSPRNLQEYWRPNDVPPGGFHAGVRVAERILEFCEGCAVQGRNQRALREGK